MDTFALLLLFAAGCLTGFLAGFFGVGGGIILVPILLAIFTTTLDISSLVATHLTLGTSLLVVVFASLTSAYQYYKNGHVVPRAALFIGATSVLAAFAGAAIASVLRGKALQQIFAAVVTVAAVGLLLQSEGSKQEKPMKLSPGGLMAIGGVTGLVSSLAGVGGGVFSIPMMYSLMNFPVKKALGTSSATIVITGLAATLGYVLNGLGDPDLERYSHFTLGYVDYLHAIPVVAGTLPFAKFGATLAHRTHGDRLRKLYAVFLIVIAARMFLL